MHLSLSIDLANMLCCFHDHNCGTAKSSDKQNETVCLRSSLNTYVAILSIGGVLLGTSSSLLLLLRILFLISLRHKLAIYNFILSNIVV